MFSLCGEDVESHTALIAWGNLVGSYLGSDCWPLGHRAEYFSGLFCVFSVSSNKRYKCVSCVQVCLHEVLHTGTLLADWLAAVSGCSRCSSLWPWDICLFYVTAPPSGRWQSSSAWGDVTWDGQSSVVNNKSFMRPPAAVRPVTRLINVSSSIQQLNTLTVTFWRQIWHVDHSLTLVTNYLLINHEILLLECLHFV